MPFFSIVRAIFSVAWHSPSNRGKEIYNLTWRNSSRSVAYALEASLDGVLVQKIRWSVFMRLFFRSELWIAAQLRHRAVTMALTSGLVLDYSRALHGLMHPVSQA